MRPGGVSERLPVAASSAPFDADLGPDSAGRPAVVYSRCTDPRKPAVGGCDLFIHSIGVDGERAIGTANTAAASEYEPSLWRGEVAWVRSYGEGRPVVYTRPLTARRSLRSVRQPGLPARNCAVQFNPGDCTTRRRELTHLELHDRYLAMVGRYNVEDEVGFSTNEVRLVDRRRRRSRRVALLSAGEGGQTFLGLSFTPGRLGRLRASPWTGPARSPSTATESSATSPGRSSAPRVMTRQPLPARRRARWCGSRRSTGSRSPPGACAGARRPRVA